ncbi:LPXTG cell wall anchor domain-containing protein [Demequina zhanjiangensis]|uniref:LPXTG cell wall anchor domain-containing protein n=1 Tax=Demequina zhanjiangensis TaxID=3051659 RepID=A0ABT8G1J2_9MICO|nr:LPXTG cell wall anchor domain-containing protein [Demequina sp. SYSU T00b26]MDN4473001.1 LPXTG cell wall anchor domain-containing protein [Demequina sp. SYSU T00b26]
MHFRPRPFSALALAAAATLVAAPAVACEDEPATSSDSPHQIAVTPDCTTAYVTDANGDTVSVIDLTTGTTFASVAIGVAQGEVAITPDGGQAWISVETYAEAERGSWGPGGWTRSAKSAHAEITIVDTDTQEVTGTVATAGAASSIAFSRDGSTAYATSGEARSTISAIDTETHEVTSFWGFSSPYDVVASADGTTLWVSEMHSGKVKKVDARDGSILDVFSIGRGKHARELALSEDESLLYVASPDDDGVVVLDSATGQWTATIATGHAPSGVQVSPDGARILVSASADGSVTEVDAVTYSVTATATVSVTASFTVTLLCDGTAVHLEEDDDAPAVVDTPEITAPEPSVTPESTMTPNAEPTVPDCPCADGGEETPEPEPTQEPCDGAPEQPPTSPEPSPSAPEPSSEPSSTAAPSETAQPTPSTPTASPEPSGSPATPTAPPATPSSPEASPAAPSPTASAKAEVVTSPTPVATAVPASDDTVGASAPESASDELAQTGASPSLAIAATIAALVLGTGLLIARRRTHAK